MELEKAILISSLKLLGLHKYFDRSVLSGLVYTLLWMSYPGCWYCHCRVELERGVQTLADFTVKGRAVHSALIFSSSGLDHCAPRTHL